MVTGAGLIVHGVQKLFGWVGGPGLEGFAQTLSQAGYPATDAFALLTALTEVGAGLLFIAGLAAPLAAAGIIGVMTNAVVATHIPNGFWETSGDRAVLYGFVAITVALTGPGMLALDKERSWAHGGISTATASIAVGSGAAVVALIFRAIA